MSIKLSPKHGLNPSIELCFFCWKEKGLVIPGRLVGDQEAPREAVWNHEPCDECAKLMKDGIIFISTRDGEKGDNPYRTGGWAVITEDAAKRIIAKGPTLDHVLKARVCFIEDTVWKMLGFPEITLPS